MKCKEGSCGIQDVEDNICCFFCKLKNNCKMFCTAIDRECVSEEDIEECENYEKVSR